MGEALARLAKEDPSFKVSSDESLGKQLLKNGRITLRYYCW